MSVCINSRYSCYNIFLLFFLIIFIILMIVLITIFNYKIKLFIMYKKIKKNRINKNLNLVNFNVSGTLFSTGKGKIINNNEIYSKSSKKFKFKNSIGLILNKLIVLDIDSNIKYSFLQYLPNNTVITKTPRGYHYYFFNNININVENHIALNYKNRIYPIDLFSGNQLCITPPTIINNKEYKWINDISNVKILNISDYYWIIELFKFTKIFKSVNLKLKFKKLPYQNTCIFLWDRFCKNEFKKYFSYSNITNYKSIKNICQIITIHNNHFLLMETHPKYYNNINNLLNKLIPILKSLSIKNIIDISTVGGFNYKIGSVLQINNIKIDYNIYNSNKKYTNNKIISSKCLIDITKNYTPEIIYITKYFNLPNKYIKLSGEDCFVSTILSNKLNLKCMNLIGISDNFNYKQYNNGGAKKAAQNLLNYYLKL